MNEHFFIAGPCVIESELIIMKTAERLKKIAEKYNIEIIFKSSFDKANRTSISSFRGPGIDEGLKVLSKVKETFGFKLTTDIHLPHQASVVADVVDVIQIPAFLCRQTDMIVEAAKTSKTVNIKKGQFVAPWDMRYAVQKAKASGGRDIWLTERGSSFGYNNLVVDFRSLRIMKEFARKVVYDATHSMQMPSVAGKSLGTKEYASWLAFAAASVGVDGLFFEVHPEPDKALSDAAVMLSIDEFEKIVPVILQHWQITDRYEKNS
ncbi:3-deoxy-8-phosphooctulonate synthase [Hippea maritima]|uniref:3-deoxy-8-phosphooctulonate synthase n=1 Tax=Hippea maritima (strain ATCC 700847 / DSM 10411 / MH2) TaxID=760142 RepID=F2LUF3_HIPMA|nr:3-deoxy-8-phosphooctulonate synthase [Hippea maritima]AEA33479.1 2-dehydro-3-deoxyphosphooctonate aldolase [Hippea maritima DSM 10411]